MPPDPGELEAKRGGVVAGVDDDRFGGAALRADDVAVRADRAELVAVDGKRHPAIESNRPVFWREPGFARFAAVKQGTVPVVESWDLQRSRLRAESLPVVLYSDNEARVVLIGLEPGQELGEHQVKEHALAGRRRRRGRRSRPAARRSTPAPARSCASIPRSATRSRRTRRRPPVAPARSVARARATTGETGRRTARLALAWRDRVADPLPVLAVHDAVHEVAERQEEEHQDDAADQVSRTGSRRSRFR